MNKVVLGVFCAVVLFAVRFAYGKEVKFRVVESTMKEFTEELGKMFDDGKPIKLASIQKDLKKERLCRISPVASTGKTLSPESIYTKCADSIVVVGRVYKCEDCDKWHTSAASGFVIRKDGVIVTNYHVLNKGKDGKIDGVGMRTRDGRIFPIEKVMASSELHDLAVIKVEADNLKPLSISNGAEVGSDIYCISHPVSQLYTMTEGIVAGNFLRKKGDRDMAVTCDYAKGSSGAPILDKTGSVVGIVRATSPVYYERKHNKNDQIQMVWKYCIPSRSLLELMGQK